MEAGKDYGNKNNTTILYNSHICRLCSVKDANGYSLFTNNEDLEDLSGSINKYLPVKISDDGKYPRWICGGCHLQVEATVQFFQLIENGQKILNEFYQSEIRQHLLNVNSINNNSDTPLHLNSNILENRKDSSSYILIDFNNGKTDLESLLINKLTKINNKKQNSLLIILNEFSNNSNLKNQQIALSISAKESQAQNTTKSEYSLKTESKKKQELSSKPNKNQPISLLPNEVAELNENPPLQKQELLINDENNDGYSETNKKTKRTIKLPVRYQNDVYGTEYEQIYHDMGITEKNDYIDENNFLKINYNVEDDDNGNEDLIGFVQNEDGESLGDLILIQNINDNSNENRKLRKKQLKIVNNDHVIKQKTLFVCDVCQIYFSQENKFFKHRLSHKNVRFECKECLKTYKNKNLLIDHQRNENHFDAGIIEEYFDDNNLKGSNKNAILELISENEPLVSTKRNMDNGMLFKNTKSTEVDENLCDSVNQSLNLKVMNNKNLKCKICNDGITFKNRSSLNYHIINKHNNGCIFVCRKCNKQFKSKNKLKNHQLIHTNVRPYKCEECGKGFKLKSIFIAHKSLHTGDQKFSCEKCDQKFAHKRSLKLHKFIHEDKKPFECNECGKRFRQLGNMQEHYRIHTDQRPFVCPICKKNFRTSSHCRMHIKRHQIERPLKCISCSKSFVNNHELLMHLRRHNNIKPFKCNECSKDFVDLQGLKKHNRIHTGERPYKCNMCEKKFSDRSNLRRHQNTHLNKKQLELLEQQE